MPAQEHTQNYATFWQRFAAIWIDILVLVPLTVVHEVLQSVSKSAALALVVPMAGAYLAYDIYYHGRFGQTVGKRVMEIRVVKTTGDRIGWREAWLRSSVSLGFSLLYVVGSFAALATISDADYYGVGWIRRAQNLGALRPSWLHWTNIANNIWGWSELATMLFNRRRRALHDFIAGTVVTSERSKRPLLGVAPTDGKIGEEAMACRGVHFAITVPQAECLLAAEGDEAVMEIIDEIEKTWDTENLAESDKAWDAIHRCLTDGRLECGNGNYPLNHCVLGPRQLHKGEGYIVSLVLPEEVRDVAKALETVTLEWFERQYTTVLPKDCAQANAQEDLDYTLANLESVKQLFQKASVAGRAVVFSVEQ